MIDDYSCDRCTHDGRYHSTTRCNWSFSNLRGLCDCTGWKWRTKDQIRNTITMISRPQPRLRFRARGSK